MATHAKNRRKEAFAFLSVLLVGGEPRFGTLGVRLCDGGTLAVKGVHLLKHISVLDKHNQFLNLISASRLVDLVTICRQVGLENDSIYNFVRKIVVKLNMI